MKKAIVFALTLAALAFMMVPNLRAAMKRGHQKKVMADLRAIATAWEARATDLNTYAIAPGVGRPRAADMKRALVPKYIRDFPDRDPWGRNYEFQASPQSYTIRSLGPDPRLSTDDVIYGDGSFIRWPQEVTL